jgi:hypothetical protein
MHGDLEARVAQLAADRKELEAAEESAERSAQFAAKMGNSASSTDEPVDVDTKTAPGAKSHRSSSASQPLRLSITLARTVRAHRSRRTCPPRGNVPPQLPPDVAGPLYKDWLLDRLPVRAIGAPTYRYVRHPLGAPGHEGPTVIVGRNGMRVLTERAWTKARNNHNACALPYLTEPDDLTG